MDNPLRDAATFEDKAGQDKEGYRQQREIGDTGKKIRGNDGSPQLSQPDHQEGRDPDGDGNGSPQDQQEQEAEKKQNPHQPFPLHSLMVAWMMRKTIRPQPRGIHRV